VKRQSRKQRPWQRKVLCIEAKSIDVQQMEGTQHNQQQHQQRHNARKAYAVKGDRPHGCQRTKPTQRS
jgi:hypothetical protein